MNPFHFYRLEQEPFSNAPVSRFYFDSQQTQAALLRVQRIISEMKGLAVVIGEIGAGKTTLARKLLDSLPESEYEAALLVIIHSGVTADWLLRRIAQQLGVQDPAKEKLQLLSQLYKRLLQIAESGRKAVVLIDEAQMLQTREIMEEFRGVLNLEIPEKKLITFVFFGLPEIEQNLKLDPPLLQRVAMKYRLNPMDHDSTVEYIEHRLKLAGATRDVFEPSAMRAIYEHSKGSPRLINTIADNAIFEGALVQAPVITKEIIDRVSQDLGLDLPVPPAPKVSIETIETVERMEPSFSKELHADLFQDKKPQEITGEHHFIRKEDEEHEGEKMIDELEETST